MKKVLVVMPMNSAQREYIKSVGRDCEFVYSDFDAPEEQVCGADIIIGCAKPELAAKSERLQWIQLDSAGADEYCGRLRGGAILTSATGAYGLTVSEYMLTVTLMLCRKMNLYMRNQVEGIWRERGGVASVWGSTALVIGLGDIGREYARRMKALGAHVIGIRRHVGDKPDCVDELFGMDALDTLLPRADFVSMVLPRSAETHHIMDARRMRLMKKSAYLINAGRGDAVDCLALAEALSEGAIAGAALDVTEPEPLPQEHPLWSEPRCIITPHIAGRLLLPETIERIVRIAGENLGKFLAGDTEHMRNVIDASGRRH